MAKKETVIVRRNLDNGRFVAPTYVKQNFGRASFVVGRRGDVSGS